jgi:F0F1-type ATP synthase assembly protein I
VTLRRRQTKQLQPKNVGRSAKDAAVLNHTTTDTAGSDLEQYVEAFGARQQFLGAVMSLSWRLAFTILIPVIVGIKMDQYFNSSPSYTLAGLMLAALGGSIAVWDTVKEVNATQSESDKEKKNVR